MQALSLIGLTMVTFTAAAVAQGAPPKVGNKPIVQVKPNAPMGCKLVGTVKGTKIWAGECSGAAELRGPAPAVDVAPSPSGQKQ
jgi:hypothetical protein